MDDPMAQPNSRFGTNIELSGGYEIAGSTTDPPTDGSTDADFNGSLALTQTGLYQRIGTVWNKFTTASNSAAGRFITGTITLTAAGGGTASIPAPTGASNGDRVFLTSSVGNTNNIVIFTGQISGGNLTVTARNTLGAATAPGGDTDVYFMIDTST